MPKPIPSSDLPPIQRLREVMHCLRSPGGCPWDAEQTHESLVKHLIEEAYEVADAIQSGDREAMVDELGDLLLQPVFHAEIAAESGSFDFDDVANAIVEKLIRRHPHVFGDAVAETPDRVLSQWEAIKAVESGDEQPVSMLKKVNDGLPSLAAAQKIQKKVSAVGFDWPGVEPVVEKVAEELQEVREAIESGEETDIAEEIGDLLFATVNLARKAGLEAEILLHQANAKFVERFRKIEEKARLDGRNLESVSLDEMEEWWGEVKIES